ncbi:MAG: hypothetical protein HY827_03470 [Actinobacteria bacterium]|nr:hypothetical protein [Actinomycetota bacterium]
MRLNSFAFARIVPRMLTLSFAVAFAFAVLLMLSVVPRAEATLGTTTITSGPTSGWTNDPDPTFSFKASISGASFRCSIDGVAFTACTSPFTTPVLTQGAHTFRVKAIVLTSYETTTATASFKVDSIPPTVKITAPVNNTVTSASSTTLKFTAGDSSGVAPKCDKTNGSTVWLALGINTIKVTCTDSAGNKSSDTATVKRVKPDTTPPVVSITEPTNGSVTSAPTTVLRFTATDNSGVAPTCDKADGTTVALNLGQNVISVTCNDQLNNTATSSVTVTREDVTPPAVDITEPADGSSTGDAAATLHFTVTDDSGATPSCDQTDGASVSLSLGSNTITVTCTDSAGNSGSDTVSLTRVDVTPPTVDITAPIDGSSTPSSSTTLHFTATDDSGATPSCDQTDGASVSLSLGSNTISVSCTDAAGNSGSDSVSVTRLSPPDTTMSGPTGPTNDSTPTYALSSDVAGATFACSVDSGSYLSTGASFTTTTLSAGSHTIRCRATANGLTDASPASATVLVDTLAPTLSLNCAANPDSTIGCTFTGTDPSTVIPGTPPGTCISIYPNPCCPPGAVCIMGGEVCPPGMTCSGSPTCIYYITPTGPAYQCTYPGTPTITIPGSGIDHYECSVDSGPFTACTSPYTTAVLPTGTHTIQVRVFDKAGNTFTSASTQTL